MAKTTDRGKRCLGLGWAKGVMPKTLRDVNRIGLFSEVWYADQSQLEHYELSLE